MRRPCPVRARAARKARRASLESDRFGADAHSRRAGHGRQYHRDAAERFRGGNRHGLRAAGDPHVFRSAHHSGQGRARDQQPELNARVEGTVSINGPLFVKTENTPAPEPRPPFPSGAAKCRSCRPATLPGELGLNVMGRLTIPEGRLTLPTARFTILPPGHIVVSYPAPDASANGVPTLGIDVDLQARTRLSATSLSGIRKLYTVTVAARGPISGATLDPDDGRLAPRPELHHRPERSCHQPAGLAAAPGGRVWAVTLSASSGAIPARCWRSN